jgi:hypothetical protein
MKYVRYVIWTHSVGGCATLLEITSNGVSLECQFLKLGFIQHCWIILAVHIEYSMELIRGNEIERFL